jgi:hypothetical protein
MDSTGIRELYPPARVTLNQVAFLVIEPPDVRYDWLTPGSIKIDVGVGRPSQSASTVPPSPGGNSTSWMYLGEMNRFLLFSAGEVSLDWTGPEENRT